MIEYRLRDANGSDSHYSLSYQELREHHERLCRLSDRRFLQPKHLIESAHLACIVGWLKELSRDATIGDRGIVHELIHLMTGIAEDDPGAVKRIREQFKALLELA